MLLSMLFFACAKQTPPPPVSNVSNQVDTDEVEDDSQKKEAPTTLTIEAITTTTELSVVIGEESQVVSSVYISCGDYRQEQTLVEGRVLFTDVPSELQCTLQFMPSNLSLAGITARSEQVCTVSTETVVCE